MDNLLAFVGTYQFLANIFQSRSCQDLKFKSRFVIILSERLISFLWLCNQAISQVFQGSIILRDLFPIGRAQLKFEMHNKVRR